MKERKEPKPYLTASTDKNRRGVITVEAALIMSVTIGVLVLLYSLAMIDNQNTVARAEAMRVASRVAQNWNLIGGDYSILNEDLKKTVFSADTVGDGSEEAAGEKGKTGNRNFRRNQSGNVRKTGGQSIQPIYCSYHLQYLCQPNAAIFR